MPNEDAYLDPLQLTAIVCALVGLVLALNQGGVAVGKLVSGGDATFSFIVTVVCLVVGSGFAGAVRMHVMSCVLPCCCVWAFCAIPWWCCCMPWHTR